MKHKSDSEYVEQVRKGLKINRRLRLIRGIIGAIGTMFVVVMAINVSDVPSGLSPTPSGAELARRLYWLAIIMGLGIGMALHRMLMEVVDAIAQPREQKLLVDTWDRLQIAQRQITVEPVAHANAGS